MRRLLAPFVVLAALVPLGCADADADDPAVATADCPAAFAEPLAAWGDAGYRGVVAVSTGGAFDCRYAIGDTLDAAVDTVFGIGSVSKAFTAAAIGQLVDAGTIDPTDRAGDLVDGLTGPVADATVEQLLDHTSGLLGTHAEDADPITHDDAVAAISRLELAFPPGTDELYSNAGYTLLAMIVEATSGSTYQDYVREHVATTGGDFTTTHWATAGNGDLAMTVPQLADWTRAFFTGDPDPGPEPPSWAAFDAELFGAPFLATAGGGGDTGEDAAVAYLPDTDRVVAMASTAESTMRAEDLLRATGPALATDEPIPTPDEPVEVDPDVLADAAGDYESGFTVAVDDDGLLVSATTPSAVAALFPRDAGADDHEVAVLAALRGETGPGRDELAALEEDLGAVEDVEVLGTIVAEGELRTYVTLTAAEGDTGAWYALDDGGGIAGAELTDEPPTLRFVPAAGGRFVPDDPTGAGPEVTVSFADGEIVID